MSEQRPTQVASGSSQPAITQGILFGESVVLIFLGPVIDHLAYPHIIDSVLAHADVKLLLRFRQTATKYSARCIQAIGSHLIVGSTNSSPLVLTSSRGPLPRLSGLSPISYAEIERRIDNSQWLYTHCRILDFHGHTGAKCPPSFIGALTSLRALRIILVQDLYTNHGLDNLTIPTLVVFGPLPGYDRSYHRLYLWEGPYLPKSHKLAWVVTALSKRVRSGPLTFPFDVPTSVVLHLRHFRLFFQVFSKPDDTLACLGMIVHEILRRHASTTVKVVELEAIAFNNGSGPDLDECKAGLLRIVDQYTSRLVFMTSPEYCAEYGAEQYCIETCEKL
ncbi:hypothetical protein CC85DRAFT_300176 [Cutaneotrichosporon oleaginosum]|uniref:Uncharacterized protein n=1 Tax=Cutaneotrichosporon oleaginosum TaxID=879819 RepID=A0A0J1B9T7_9TREE|nr:uncharacterized protein CC85DRAFT_300176 [Cutaneotrichosporon oleaginosum]KLT44624.1 hypothetical protein CC85DRAFT_300176 [Cutaneotrichosporon oleaginosum]TXT07610.1 hypothetical protein COLE_04534 [Cutaneotrichosporon oleaginosum]